MTSDAHRSLVVPMYLPAFLLAVGDGALTTFLPLHLLHMGTPVALAAVLVGVGGAGVLLMDLPSGFLVRRYGERRMLLGSGILMTGATLLIAAVPSPVVATAGLFIASAAAASWLIGRLEFMRKALGTTSRGRGLATVGGVMRGGLLLGPFAGGLVATAAGYRVVFLCVAGLTGAAVAFFAISGTGEGPGERAIAAPIWDSRALARVARAGWKVLATAGLTMAILSMARSGRSILLPLWGQSIGLDDARLGLAVGVSSAGDMLMFIPAGLLSDRRGRKWSAVSCLLFLSLGLALLPLTRSFGGFLAVVLLVGMGNGLGSGINMTLGADFSAGSAEPGVFLGAWRLVTDLGGGAAPFLVGIVAGAIALGPAALVIAGVGLAGAALHAARVPETNRLPRA